MPTNYLEGMPEKILSCHFPINTWSSQNATGTLKVGLAEKKNAYTENNLYVSIVKVEVLWCFSAVFPPKALGTLVGYLAP